MLGHEKRQFNDVSPQVDRCLNVRDGGEIMALGGANAQMMKRFSSGDGAESILQIILSIVEYKEKAAQTLAGVNRNDFLQ